MSDPSKNPLSGEPTATAARIPRRTSILGRWMTRLRAILSAVAVGSPLNGFLLMMLVVGSVRAQDPPALLDIQVGFKPLSPGPRTPTHKVGLWTPVFVEVDPGLPQGPDKPLEISLESEDSVDNATLSRFPVPTIPNRGTLVRGYVKPGHVRNDLRIALHPKDSPQTLATATIQPRTSGLGDYIYLSLGAKLDDLAEALTLKESSESKNTRVNRFAVYETDPERLPDRWIGYDGIDLVILDTSNRQFNDTSGKWYPPLLEWARRGGRLVIAADGSKLFPPRAAKSLVAIEAWAGLHDKPFPARGEPAVPIARIDAGTGEILVQYDDPAPGGRSLPLIVRKTYGFGSVTTIAFPLASGSFVTWSGRVEFLRTLIDQLGPRYVPAEQLKNDHVRTDADIADWGARLERNLDAFDVPSFSFGWVAFFMLGAIVLVSVADAFILRRVFGRLEATWITLPLLVLAIGGIVMCALARSGDPGMLVNHLELIDLRSEWAAGSECTTVWTGVRSDLIRSLDVCRPADAMHDRDVVAWNGRPDDGPAGMGRAGGVAFSQKSYGIAFERERLASHLTNVPFAYRGTRAFLSEGGGRDFATFQPPPLLPPGLPGINTDDTALPRILVSSDMAYHPRDHGSKASGTIDSDLPFDLDDAVLFVFDRVYPIPGGVKKGKTTIDIKATEAGMLPSEWRGPDNPTDPGFVLRNLLFHERLDPSLRTGNHLFRRLDWSWRLRDDPRVINVPLSVLGTREAILIGRAKVERPGIVLRQGETEIAAKRTCDTYVRAIVPLKPLP